MAHTPGPWHPGHLGSDSACQCRSVVSEGMLGSICQISVDNEKPVGEGGNDAPSRDEAIANMHLIAAAPEMLQALHLVGMSAGWQYMAFETRDIIRATIAKAEGRS